MPPRRDPLARVISLQEQLLQELHRGHEPRTDFSVTKLLAGIVQILALAVLFAAFFYRGNTEMFLGMLLTAIFLEVFTVALLIMDRQ